MQRAHWWKMTPMNREDSPIGGHLMPWLQSTFHTSNQGQMVTIHPWPTASAAVWSSPCQLKMDRKTWCPQTPLWRLQVSNMNLLKAIWDPGEWRKPTREILYYTIVTSTTSVKLMKEWHTLDMQTNPGINCPLRRTHSCVSSEEPVAMLLTTQEDHLTSTFTIVIADIVTSVPEQFICRCTKIWV